MDIENIFEKMGNWGTYQKRLCVLVGLSTIPNGIFVMLMIFTHETPPHRCFIPDMDNTTGAIGANITTSLFNTTEVNILRRIPLEMKNGKPTFSQCKLYADRESYSAEAEVSAEVTAHTPGNGSGHTTGCKHGWIYDIPPGRETVITKWDLVCDRAWVKPLATSSYMLGAVVAAFVAGYISDRFGRQPTFFWSTILQGVFGLLCGISVSVPMYLVCLTLCGGLGFTNIAAAIVLAAEVMPKNMRGVVGNIIFIGFAVGYMVLPLIAYLTSTWRDIYYTLASLALFAIPYWWLLLESPRWLILSKRPEKAKEILKKMAKVNGTWSTELKESINEDINVLAERVKNEGDGEGNVQYSFLDIVRHPVALKRISILSYSWIILNMVYYFFSYNTGNLGGTTYVNCLIAAFMEIPAGIMCIFLMDYVGRTIPYVTLMVASAISCAIVPFLLGVNSVAAIAIAMLGRFLIAAAFDVVVIYTPEVFPTLMRNKAFGVASCVGRIGGISAPYLIYWGENVNRYIPYIIMSVLCITGGISSLLVPETSNQPVPSTMQEAKKLKTLLQQYGCRRRNGKSNAVKA